MKCASCNSNVFRRINGVHFCGICSTQKTPVKEVDCIDSFMLFGPQEVDCYDVGANDIEKRVVSNEVITEDLMNFAINNDVDLKPNFCYNCGNELQNKSANVEINFCPKCGVSQNEKSENPFSSSLRSSASSISIPTPLSNASSLRGTPSDGGFSPFEKESFSGTPYQRKGSVSRNLKSFSNTPETHYPANINNIDDQTNLQNTANLFCGMNMLHNSSESAPQVIPQGILLRNTPSDGGFSCSSPFEKESFSGTPYQRKGSVSRNVKSFSNTPEMHDPININNIYDQTSLHNMATTTFNSNLSTPPILSHSFKSSSNSFVDMATDELSNQIDNTVPFRKDVGLYEQSGNMFRQADCLVKEEMLMSCDSYSLAEIEPSLLFKVEDFHSNDMKSMIDDVYNEMNPNRVCSTGNPAPELSTTVSKVETDDFGDTKLHLLIQGNNTEDAIEEMRKLSNEFNDALFKDYLNKRNDRRAVAVHSAVRNGNVHILDTLLQYGVDVTLLDHSGNNILHQIVFTSHSEENVLTLFQVVFKHEAMYRVELETLLNHNEKAFNSDGFAVVHELARRSFGEALKLIKNKGAKLNMRGRKEKQTPLILAAKERRWDIVKILCSLGACVNIPTSSGWYAVHATIEDNDQEMLNYFMEKGVVIYGITRMEISKETKDLCEKYMRRKRRRNGSTNTRSGSNCNCGSSESCISQSV